MKVLKVILLSIAVALVTGCGTRVEVPPAHVGKIMTRDGYQPGRVGSSKFRLAPCWFYCDRLVLIDISDRAVPVDMKIFMPQDKLDLNVQVQLTMSIDPKKVDELFNTLPPVEAGSSLSHIAWDQIYKTYAIQVVLTKTREYLSRFTIAEVASSQERVNSELSVILAEALVSKTPFIVRHIGITKTEYPPIITEAQENAAKRREQIQQEEAQLEISKVQLERELQETRLRRQIDIEKAQVEAQAQQIQKEVIDEKVLALRRIENQRAWIEKWDGSLPATMLSDDGGTMLMLSGDSK